uniref:Uncharacterized protein n=1 Tax=Arundo donax TaxID=35708 RepID=A0A0A9GM54_ARUDO
MLSTAEKQESLFSMCLQIKQKKLMHLDEITKKSGLTQDPNHMST